MGHLLLQGLHLAVFGHQIISNGFHTVLGLFHLGRNTAAAAFLTCHIVLIPADIFLVIADACLQNSNLSVNLLMRAFQHIHLNPQVLHAFTAGAKFLSQLLGGGIEIFQLLLGLLTDKAGRNIVLLCLFGILGQLFQLIHPNGNLNALKFFLQS